MTSNPFLRLAYAILKVLMIASGKNIGNNGGTLMSTELTIQNVADLVSFALFQLRPIFVILCRIPISWVFMIFLLFQHWAVKIHCGLVKNRETVPGSMSYGLNRKSISGWEVRGLK